MVVVAFFIRHFSERGTEVSIYNYAHFNETILGNKSIILCLTPEAQKRNGLPDVRHSFKKFNDRFPVIEFNGFHEMPILIPKLKLDFFYTQTYGGYGDIYNFNDKTLWVPPCKTIKHCVFDTSGKEGDYYISIGNQINRNDYKVIPYIVYLPELKETITDTNTYLRDMRTELNIPENAFVFGRHGGICQFNLEFVKNAVIHILEKQPDFYFVFLNTPKFYIHPRIKYLELNTDLQYKVRFINTCDAMIHARDMGETFGLAVGEFSLMNKPIFTSNRGEKEHICILGEKAIVYNDYDDLMEKFSNVREIVGSREDWNAYQDYSPEKVMELFRTYIFENQK